MLRRWKGGNEHNNELGGADLHGIGQQLGLEKLTSTEHVSCCTEKNDRSQDKEFAPVGAHSSGVHWSAPPFRLGKAEQQPVPALPRRMAFRPYLSR